MSVAVDHFRFFETPVESVDDIVAEALERSQLTYDDYREFRERTHHLDHPFLDAALYSHHVSWESTFSRRHWIAEQTQGTDRAIPFPAYRPFLGQEIITDLVHRDTLTGAYNRRFAEFSLRRAVSTAYASGGYVTVLYLDLNGFKALNDVQGHDAGDEALREVTSRVHSQARSSDIVTRLGGDEFMVILEGVDPEKAYERGNEILEAINGRPLIIGDHVCEVTATGGISTLYGAEPTVIDPREIGEQLMRLADRGMLAAKGQKQSGVYSVVNVGNIGCANPFEHAVTR